MLGGVAELISPKARAIGHATFWGLNVGLFSALLAYFWKRTSGGQKNMAPFTLTLLGALLIMVDLSRHILLDLGLAGAELAMYTEEGELSTVGMVGLVCTWVGMVLLATGISWFADLPGKVAAAIEGLVKEAKGL